MLDPLQKTGHPYLDEFVEIVRRNRQKFHPLEQRVPNVPRLLEHAPVEFQPFQVPVEINTRIVKRSAGHNLSQGTKSDSPDVLRADEHLEGMLSFRAFPGGMMRLTHFLFAISLLSVSIDLNAQAPSSFTDKRADAIFSTVTREDAPGLAVAIRKNGRALLLKGYGVRDLRTNAKIDSITNFRLASFTKQFTATAVMLLVRDGKLRYDQTLTEIFPDFPGYGKAVTIRHLLTHTSGLPDYEDLMDAAEKVKGPLWSPEHQVQDDEVLALLKKEAKGKFAAGTSWSYSNSGYVVLGLIVAKASGQSYGDFVHARIFAPLHMDHTIVYHKGKNEVTNRAFGHSKDGDSFKEADQSSTSATLGDGGIYSNLEDLAKWDDARGNHTLLSAD